MKMKTKAASILLALTLVFTMMPLMTGKAYAAEEYNVYELTEEFLPGNNYIITASNTGRAAALDNIGAQLGSSWVTIENGKIRNTDVGRVFGAIGSGTTVNNLSSRTRYLIGTTESFGGQAEDKLALIDEPIIGRAWIYSDGILKNTDGNKDYYVYYDGRVLDATTSSTAATTVYLFKEVPYVEYTVTFEVENGKWSNGNNEEIKITLAGPKDTGLKLSADQIPGVGNDPDTHYKEGSWDTTPDTTTTITADTTYTYTYKYADHIWGELAYTWAEDNSKVTASHTCSIDGEKEEETVDTTEQEITKPTCTEKGENKLTAAFTKKGFSVQEKIVEVAALGHVWDSGTVTKKATTTATGVRTYTCTVCEETKTETIPKLAKKANPLTIKARTATVKGCTRGRRGKLKRNKTLAISKVIRFTKKGQGKMTYIKVTGNKKITINKTTGKVTVKKGLKKGTYKVKIKVKAAGNANYKASAWKRVTSKIRVK